MWKYWGILFSHENEIGVHIQYPHTKPSISSDGKYYCTIDFSTADGCINIYYLFFTQWRDLSNEQEYDFYAISLFSVAINHPLSQ